MAFCEKGLPFRQRMLEDEGAMDELKAVWPFGQFPILKEGDRTWATLVDLELPSHELFNISAGVTFDNGVEAVVYVNNGFDENPLLSFDRERGGRARLGYAVGTPRTAGVTLRRSF